MPALGRAWSLPYYTTRGRAMDGTNVKKFDRVRQSSLRCSLANAGLGSSVNINAHEGPRGVEPHQHVVAAQQFSQGRHGSLGTRADLRQQFECPLPVVRFAVLTQRAFSLL